MIRTITSKATRQRRLKGDFTPDPPVCLTPPLLLNETYQSWQTFMQRVTAPGLTLSVTPGVWDTVNGPTTVVGTFQSRGSTPFSAWTDIGAPNATTLLVTEEMVNKTIRYVERGTRSGITVERINAGFKPRVEASTPLPQFSYVSAPITGGHGVGDTLTKPTYVWTSTVPIQTVTGEWWKNGVPTGVTTPTYSNTAEGDVIYWIETCTNIADDSNWGPQYLVTDPYIILYTGWARYVSQIYQDVRESMRNEVLTRIDGLPGGYTNMKWLSVRNHHPVAQYEVNPDLWAYDLKHQLSANQICRIRDWDPMGFHDNYGFIMITPRHLLTCAHIGQLNSSEKSRFLTHDGRVVESHWLSAASGSVDLPEGEGIDLQVVTMDRDLTKEGIPYMPIVQGDSAFRWGVLGLPQPTPIPICGLSKSYYAIPHDLCADYPFEHQRMLYIKSNGNVGCESTPEFAAYNYSVYSGDSGTPNFILVNDRLFLLGIMVTAPYGYVSPGATLSMAKLNALIAASDAKAVAAGKLTAPTGLTPDYVPVPDLMTWPLPPVVNTSATPYRGWFWGAQLQTTTTTTIRVQPGGDPITTAPAGSQGSVIEGPEHADNTWWYRISFAEGLIPTGWVLAADLQSAP